MMGTTTSSRRFSGRRGYALLTSLVVITLLVVASASLFTMATTSQRVTLRRKQGAQALNLAMAGLDEAVAQLKGSAAYTGFANRALGNGLVTVAVTTPPSEPLRRIVTSTGAVRDMGLTITRRVRASLDTTGIPPVFDYALASRTTMDVNGTVYVDSTPTLNVGNVHANGDLNVNSGASAVWGRADASGLATAHSSATVYGGIHSGMPQIAFPEVDQAFKEQALVNGTQTGDLVVSNGSMVKGRITGNLTVRKPSGCQVTGVVWVTGALTIEGPITGTGTIVCDRQLTLDARFDYPAASTTNLMVICAYRSATAATLDGNRTFKGIIYVPYGGVSLQGTPNFLGSIIADNIVFGGTPSITKWTDYEKNPPPFPVMCQLKGWEELSP